jgi:hypothetical protein
MDRDEMSILFSGPSIDASYQVSVHLAQRFSEKKNIKKNYQSEKNNCPWWPYLLAEWDEMKKLYRGPYIDASIWPSCFRGVN